MLCILISGALVFSASSQAVDITEQSGPSRTHLLELFTSEGCSSCPPAERWFSTLRQSPRLWKEVVLVAFHVDYWDALGWIDSLASKANTNRQRNYAASWGTKTVYTPGFVLNGAEWRGRDLEAIPSPGADGGKLVATLAEDGSVQITYSPSTKPTKGWQAHAALLGFGLSSEVKAGENSGRRLVHDFVVLSLQTSEMSGDTPRATMRLPARNVKLGQSAFAVWITETGKLEPLQAAGCNL
jgi:hypothetical protein